MVIFCVLFILVSIQGHDCNVNLKTHSDTAVTYLVNAEDSVCIVNSDGKSQPTNCIQKPFVRDLEFDFNFNEGTVCFFIRTEYAEVCYESKNLTHTVKLNWQNILPSYSPSCLWQLQEYIEVVGMAFDWIHNTVYTIDYKGARLTGNRCLRPETPFSKALNLTIDVEDFGRSIGVTSEEIYFVDVQVDPYEKSLFMKISFVLLTFGTYIGTASLYCSVIVRSSLEATNSKIITNCTFDSNMQFYVDVNEQNIYTLEKNVLKIYNYDGIELSSRTLNPAEIKRIVVFQKVLHYLITDKCERASYILQIDLVKFPNSSTIVAQLFGDKNSMMLLDARSKRRMVNGTYLCDRKDCPDMCEVLPSGDTCICRKSRAKTRDGLTCYDCGQSNLTTIPDQLMIKGGQDASRADFPWHSTIYELQNGEWDQTCGGTLISPSVVLTAAHCVTNMYINKKPELKETDKLMVALGKIFREWNIRELTEMRIRVKEIRPHEDFMGWTVNYAQDIALLILESKVNNYTRFVMPACLDYNINQLPHYSTLTAYVPGFGYMDELGSLNSERSKVLKYAYTTEVISFLDCFKASQTIKPSNFLVLTPDRFCIGNGSASAVQKGDSGGGLTLVHNGLHYVYGVVSIKMMKLNGISVSYSFGSFTNVSHNMDWLLRNMPEGE